MDPNQPRQPHDLQGLIKFCIEATRGEDAINSDPDAALANMDPERRQWLEQALASMSVDVIKEMTEAIKILNSHASQDPNAIDDDVGKVEYAFECISDWVDQIDMANNFHKIGGFESLKNCLHSPHASLRSASANTIAELSQNNPYCQEHFVKDGFLPLLLESVTKDQGQTCQVKAMYALSCIIRECPEAQEAFLNQHNGPEMIMNATMSNKSSEKLKIKGCFFVSSLCEESEVAKKIFIEMGLARQLLTLLQMEEHSQSHEHMARALLTVLKGNKSVRDELVNSSELKLRAFLITRLKLIGDQEEFDEEKRYLQDISDECYGKNGLQECKPVDR